MVINKDSHEYTASHPQAHRGRNFKKQQFNSYRILPQITMLPNKLHHNVVNLLVGQLNLLKKNLDLILYIY